jgi:hypothetical protein
MKSRECMSRSIQRGVHGAAAQRDSATLGVNDPPFHHPQGWGLVLRGVRDADSVPVRAWEAGVDWPNALAVEKPLATYSGIQRLV